MYTKFKKNSVVLCFAFILSLFLFVATDVVAQEKVAVRHYVQLNSIVSDGDYAPFWLTANRQGLASVNASNGFARYAVFLDGKLGKSGSWSYSAAADVVAGYNLETNPSLHQLYADVSWKWLTISVGQKERFAEMRDFATIEPLPDAIGRADVFFSHLYRNNLSELGTGGLNYSGNSTPVPQVRIEVPQYVDIPGTNSWLKVKGHIAYGMFLDHNFQEDFTAANPTARYAKNVFYHSKALFLKVGKPSSFPLTIEAGLEMYSQFGGDFYTHRDGNYLSMPSKPMDFFKAFIPLSGSDETPDVEQTNISGNQLGNWHLAFTLHTAPVDIRLYGEHMFEDFSQLFFFEYQTNRNREKEIVYYPWRDIQLGIAVRNKTNFLRFVSNVQYEYMSMYDQSGAGYNDPSDYFYEQMDGCDDYYNHGIYPGWHYYGMGIGNPLVVSPVYNTDGRLVFCGNRLIAHNVGVNGVLDAKQTFMYRLKYTYSENWGTYYNPFKEKKYTTSLLADILFAPQKSKWLFSLSVAYDKSNYIGENTGVMLSVTRMGLF